MIKLLAKNAWLRRGIYLCITIIAILPMFYGITLYSIEDIKFLLQKHKEIEGIFFYFSYIHSLLALIQLILIIKFFSMFRDGFLC